MNLATKLTLFRIFLVPFFMLFMFCDNLWTRIFALFIFIIAAVTDHIDGIIARRSKTVSKFGIFLDPLADKILISAAFISFVGLKELSIPAWMVVLIITREFIITGLRLLAVSHNRIISADKTGKFKTTSQIITIIIILLVLTINSGLKRFCQIHAEDLIGLTGAKHYLGMLLTGLPFWLMLYVTILTVYSGTVYLYKHRNILGSGLEF